MPPTLCLVDYSMRLSIVGYCAPDCAPDCARCPWHVVWWNNFVVVCRVVLHPCVRADPKANPFESPEQLTGNIRAAAPASRAQQPAASGSHAAAPRAHATSQPKPDSDNPFDA